MRAEKRASPPARRVEDRIWAVLRAAAIVAVGFGLIGAVVGVVASQPAAIVLVDVIVIAIGALLLVFVRLRP